VIVAIAVALFLIAALPFPWPGLLRSAAARSVGRWASVAFLDALLFLYAPAVLAAILANAAALWFRLRPHEFASWPGRQQRARLLLLAVSSLFSLLLLEAGAAGWRAWLHAGPALASARMPLGSAALASDPDDRADSEPPTPPRRPVSDGMNSAAADQALRILVIGESSARGEPFHPWLSVPQILAWRLERVFPNRRISVDMWARGGATLEMMHDRLAGLTYRPDAMIVYVGHNEFQARYAWMREVDYYRDDRSTPWQAPLSLARVTRRLDWSPFCRLALELRDRQEVDIEPPRTITRKPVDRPVCTATETAAIVQDFRRRLDAIASHCKTLGTLPIFVIPPGNDAGYDPSRSVLAADTAEQDRVAFTRALFLARASVRNDPARALQSARELVAARPEFAEGHYILARLLERSGDWALARRHFIEARERDALPIRCPEAIREAFRAVAAQHSEVILVDGPRVLEARSSHGIVGDEFFHDAQHPNLAGYAALAEDLLRQLQARRAFGWPSHVPAPAVDPESCALHFQLDGPRWEAVCRRSAGFFHATAWIRYDPTFRKQRAAAYFRAADMLQAGVSPRAAAIPGFPNRRVPTFTHHIPTARQTRALTPVF
jgi:hypothetical protein